TLPDGSRVQASIAKDVTTKGPTFSIRKFRKIPYSPIDLVELKTASADMMAYLWLITEHGASILICGGVSSGKTSLLNCLTTFIHPEDKVISIEDTRELNIPHKNWIPAVSRSGFGILESTGKRYGDVSLFDLLKESFRMRPDYVIVGEVRGEEAYVMFQGIASGHPSMGTLHAATLDDAVRRLATPPIKLSASLIEALDVAIIVSHAREKGEAARRIKDIIEVEDVDEKTKKARGIDVFSWIASTDEFRESVAQSQLLRRIAAESGIDYGYLIEELKARKRVIDWMLRYRVAQFDHVAQVINMYYTDRKSVMDIVKKDYNPFRMRLFGDFPEK
ncbi:MAG: type II/IV secretion system ATPase subunit, partial [Candidatus Aenigmarchaeota archaeon]|nr:type II/IV secretion system ATPase subunit [Candidatus Aenigmarchaeota archaeon]